MSLSPPQIPPNQSAPNQSATQLDLLLQYGMLKRVARTGWTRHPKLTWREDFPPTRPTGAGSAEDLTLALDKNFNHVESVSEHSGRVALITSLLLSTPHPTSSSDDDDDVSDFSGGVVLLNTEGIELGKAMTMSLIHDLAEVYVSDLPPSSISGVSKIDKERLEEEAMRRICGQGGEEWGEVWKEYEEGETKCARLVKDVDLLEMYIQGYEYEIMNEDVELGEFFEGEFSGGGRKGGYWYGHVF
ncbi:hypothetical protein TrCOL_g438 [Triparma columacea]|uniref:5'-deoxynucleotidase n=1 Tax=Triparma columacea TaxID=722753 RepID=A0A9W7L6W4_9STRA|nr:hypothetical protein TrCOL_g438 [Triparma columacea]